MRIAATPLFFLLAGCAAAQTNAAGNKSALTKAWGDCIMAAVQKFDDDRTDPTSIAYGLAPKCAIDYSNLTEAMVSENWTDVGRSHMRAQMADNEMRLITSAILTWRNRSR